MFRHRNIDRISLRRTRSYRRRTFDVRSVVCQLPNEITKHSICTIDQCLESGLKIRIFEIHFTVWFLSILFLHYPIVFLSCFILVDGRKISFNCAYVSGKWIIRYKNDFAYFFRITKMYINKCCGGNGKCSVIFRDDNIRPNLI